MSLKIGKKCDEQPNPKPTPNIFLKCSTHITQSTQDPTPQQTSKTRCTQGGQRLITINAEVLPVFIPAPRHREGRGTKRGVKQLSITPLGSPWPWEDKRASAPTLTREQTGGVTRIRGDSITQQGSELQGGKGRRIYEQPQEWGSEETFSYEPRMETLTGFCYTRVGGKRWQDSILRESDGNVDKILIYASRRETLTRFYYTRVGGKRWQGSITQLDIEPHIGEEKRGSSLTHSLTQLGTEAPTGTRKGLTLLLTELGIEARRREEKRTYSLTHLLT